MRQLCGMAPEPPDKRILTAIETKVDKGHDEPVLHTLHLLELLTQNTCEQGSKLP